MRAALPIAGLLLALQAPSAMACGHCVEDKIAAVYDHASVTRAVSSSHQVAFFHVEGARAPGRATLRGLEAIAESVEGVDRGSVRVSLEAASLAVAFDPRRASLAAVHKALEKKLAGKKLSLVILRVMDSPAELKTVGR